MTTISAKTALVTGGARRVGRAIALELASAGMDVAITYQTSADEAQQVVQQIQQIGRRGAAFKANLEKADAAERVYEQFTQKFDGLYALVNNASCFAPSAIDRVTAGIYDHHMAVNARAPLMLIQKFAPMLRDHDTPGRIVNFIDIHVMGEPLPGYVAYNASKAALMQITMTCAKELAPHITVNAIAPGVIAWADSYTHEQRKQYLTSVPLGRPGTPQDAATALLFLVRDADYCTGQIIKLDGGRGLS